jgi:hypothetical protein
MSGANSEHITKLKQSIFHLSISMESPMTVTTVLALPALDRMTKNRNDPISVTLPKAAKAGTIVTVMCIDVYSCMSLALLR